jgi:hypothetical protein
VKLKNTEWLDPTKVISGSFYVVFEHSFAKTYNLIDQYFFGFSGSFGGHAVCAQQGLESKKS